MQSYREHTGTQQGIAAKSPGHSIPLFRRGSWYESFDTLQLECSLYADLNLAPFILIKQDVQWWKSRNKQSTLSLKQRAGLLERAIWRFCNGEVQINGWRQTAEEYEEAVCEMSGIPPALIKKWNAYLAYYVEKLVRKAAPGTADEELWLVSLPSNTHTCLEACMDALYQGATTWIRPSQREPFSALRWVACLLEEGWPPDTIGYYPMERSQLSRVVPCMDHAILYGGPDLQSAFRSQQNAEVRGPGRAIAIIYPSFENNSDLVHHLFTLICAESGRFCNNVSTILCLKHDRSICMELAGMMDNVTLQDTSDEEFAVAVWKNEESATAIEHFIMHSLQSGDRRLTARHIRIRVGKQLFMAPTLVEIEDPMDHPLWGQEYPFPYAAFSYTLVDTAVSLAAASTYQYIFKDNMVHGMPAGNYLTTPTCNVPAV